MGVFSDLLAGVTGFDKTNPVTALDKVVHREVDDWIARGDAEYPTAAMLANEVQSLAANVSTSGNFTLTFTLNSGETFTTASLVYNADAATIETAIDAAATTASVVGWTNGDISVSGGDANTAATVFTFDGTSVAGLNHAAIVPADVDLDDNTPGVVTTTTAGTAGNAAWGCLVAMGIATNADIPEQGDAPADFTSVSNPSHANYPSEGLIRALASTAAILDDNAVVETKILAAAGLV